MRKLIGRFLLVLVTVNSVPARAVIDLKGCTTHVCNVIRSTEFSLMEDKVTDGKDLIQMHTDIDNLEKEIKAGKMYSSADTVKYADHLERLKTAIDIKTYFNACGVKSGRLMEGVVDIYDCIPCMESDPSTYTGSPMSGMEIKRFQDLMSRLPNPIIEDLAKRVSGNAMRSYATLLRDKGMNRAQVLAEMNKNGGLARNLVNYNKILDEVDFTKTVIPSDKLAERINAIISTANAGLAGLSANNEIVTGFSGYEKPFEIHIPVSTYNAYADIVKKYSEDLSSLGPVTMGKSVYDVVKNIPSLAADRYSWFDLKGDNYEQALIWLQNAEATSAVMSTAYRRENHVVYFKKRIAVGNILPARVDRDTVNRAFDGAKKDIENEIAEATGLLSNPDLHNAARYNPSLMGQAVMKNFHGDFSLLAPACQILKENQKKDEDDERNKTIRQFLMIGCGVGAAILTFIPPTTVIGLGAGLACGAGASVASALDLAQQGERITQIRQALISRTGHKMTEQELKDAEAKFNELVGELILNLGLTALDIGMLAKSAGGIDDMIAGMKRLKMNSAGKEGNFKILKLNSDSEGFTKLLKSCW